MFTKNILGFMRLGKRRYNIKLWKTFTDCFNCLPLAAIVDEKIFCCHAGKSFVCGSVIFVVVNKIYLALKKA